MTRQKTEANKQKFQKMRRAAQTTAVILNEIASMLGYAFSGRAIGMGWAEYEDRKARRLVYEEREYLRQLKRSKFIKTKKIGKKLMVRLTAKGWQQVLRDRIRATSKKYKDGVCLIIFDVPESERRVRDTLRDVIKGLGFKMIQKSVWATEKDVLKDLCAFLQGANLHQWVQIIVGKSVRHSFIRRACTYLPTALENTKRDHDKREKNN